MNFWIVTTNLLASHIADIWSVVALKKSHHGLTFLCLCLPPTSVLSFSTSLYSDFIPDNLVSILGLLLSKEWDVTFPDSFLIHLSHLSLTRAPSQFSHRQNCRSALKSSSGHVDLPKEANVISCCLTSPTVIISIPAALETVPRNGPHALNSLTGLFQERGLSRVFSFLSSVIALQTRWPHPHSRLRHCSPTSLQGKPSHSLIYNLHGMTSYHVLTYTWGLYFISVQGPSAAPHAQ